MKHSGIFLTIVFVIILMMKPIISFQDTTLDLSFLQLQNSTKKFKISTVVLAKNVSKVLNSTTTQTSILVSLKSSRKRLHSSRSILRSVKYHSKRFRRTRQHIRRLRARVRKLQSVLNRYKRRKSKLRRAFRRWKANINHVKIAASLKLKLTQRLNHFKKYEAHIKKWLKLHNSASNLYALARKQEHQATRLYKRARQASSTQLAKSMREQARLLRKKAVKNRKKAKLLSKSNTSNPYCTSVKEKIKSLKAKETTICNTKSGANKLACTNALKQKIIVWKKEKWTACKSKCDRSKFALKAVMKQAKANCTKLYKTNKVQLSNCKANIPKSSKVKTAHASKTLACPITYEKKVQNTCNQLKKKRKSKLAKCLKTYTTKLATTKLTYGKNITATSVQALVAKTNLLKTELATCQNSVATTLNPIVKQWCRLSVQLTSFKAHSKKIIKCKQTKQAAVKAIGACNGITSCIIKVSTLWLSKIQSSCTYNRTKECLRYKHRLKQKMKHTCRRVRSSKPRKQCLKRALQQNQKLRKKIAYYCVVKSKQCKAALKRINRKTRSAMLTCKLKTLKKAKKASYQTCLSKIAKSKQQRLVQAKMLYCRHTKRAKKCSAATRLLSYHKFILQKQCHSVKNKCYQKGEQKMRGIILQHRIVCAKDAYKCTKAQSYSIQHYHHQRRNCRKTFKSKTKIKHLQACYKKASNVRATTWRNAKRTCKQTRLCKKIRLTNRFQDRREKRACTNKKHLAIRKQCLVQLKKNRKKRARRAVRFCFPNSYSSCASAKKQASLKTTLDKARCKTMKTTSYKSCMSKAEAKRKVRVVKVSEICLRASKCRQAHHQQYILQSNAQKTCAAYKGIKRSACIYLKLTHINQKVLHLCHKRSAKCIASKQAVKTYNVKLHIANCKKPTNKNVVKCIKTVKQHSKILQYKYQKLCRKLPTTYELVKRQKYRCVLQSKAKKKQVCQSKLRILRVSLKLEKQRRAAIQFCYRQKTKKLKAWCHTWYTDLIKSQESKKRILIYSEKCKTLTTTQAAKIRCWKAYVIFKQNEIKKRKESVENRQLKALRKKCAKSKTNTGRKQCQSSLRVLTFKINLNRKQRALKGLCISKTSTVARRSCFKLVQRHAKKYRKQLLQKQSKEKCLLVTDTSKKRRCFIRHQAFVLKLNAPQLATKHVTGVNMCTQAKAKAAKAVAKKLTSCASLTGDKLTACKTNVNKLKKTWNKISKVKCQQYKSLTLLKFFRRAWSYAWKRCLKKKQLAVIKCKTLTSANKRAYCRYTYRRKTCDTAIQRAQSYKEQLYYYRGKYSASKYARAKYWKKYLIYSKQKSAYWVLRRTRSWYLGKKVRCQRGTQLGSVSCQKYSNFLVRARCRRRIKRMICLQAKWAGQVYLMRRYAFYAMYSMNKQTKTKYSVLYKVLKAKVYIRIRCNRAKLKYSKFLKKGLITLKTAKSAAQKANIVKQIMRQKKSMYKSTILKSCPANMRKLPNQCTEARSSHKKQIKNMRRKCKRMKSSGKRATCMQVMNKKKKQLKKGAKKTCARRLAYLRVEKLYSAYLIIKKRYWKLNKLAQTKCNNIQKSSLKKRCIAKFVGSVKVYKQKLKRIYQLGYFRLRCKYGKSKATKAQWCKKATKAQNKWKTLNSWIKKKSIAKKALRSIYFKTRKANTKCRKAHLTANVNCKDYKLASAKISCYRGVIRLACQDYKTTRQTFITKMYHYRCKYRVSKSSRSYWCKRLKQRQSLLHLKKRCNSLRKQFYTRMHGFFKTCRKHNKPAYCYKRYQQLRGRWYIKFRTKCPLAKQKCSIAKRLYKLNVSNLSSRLNCLTRKGKARTLCFLMFVKYKALWKRVKAKSCARYVSQKKIQKAYLTVRKQYYRCNHSKVLASYTCMKRVLNYKGCVKGVKKAICSKYQLLKLHLNILKYYHRCKFSSTVVSRTIWCKKYKSLHKSLLKKQHCTKAYTKYNTKLQSAVLKCQKTKKLNVAKCTKLVKPKYQTLYSSMLKICTGFTADQVNCANARLWYFKSVSNIIVKCNKQKKGTRANCNENIALQNHALHKQAKLKCKVAKEKVPLITFKHTSSKQLVINNNALNNNTVTISKAPTHAKKLALSIIPPSITKQLSPTKTTTKKAITKPKVSFKLYSTSAVLTNVQVGNLTVSQVSSASTTLSSLQLRQKAIQLKQQAQLLLKQAQVIAKLADSRDAKKIKQMILAASQIESLLLKLHSRIIAYPGQANTLKPHITKLKAKAVLLRSKAKILQKQIHNQTLLKQLHKATMISKQRAVRYAKVCSKSTNVAKLTQQCRHIASSTARKQCVINLRNLMCIRSALYSQSYKLKSLKFKCQSTLDNKLRKKRCSQYQHFKLQVAATNTCSKLKATRKGCALAVSKGKLSCGKVNVKCIQRYSAHACHAYRVALSQCKLHHLRIQCFKTSIYKSLWCKRLKRYKRLLKESKQAKKASKTLTALRKQYISAVTRCKSHPKTCKHMEKIRLKYTAYFFHTKCRYSRHSNARHKWCRNLRYYKKSHQRVKRARLRCGKSKQALKQYIIKHGKKCVTAKEGTRSLCWKTYRSQVVKLKTRAKSDCKGYSHSIYLQKLWKHFVKYRHSCKKYNKIAKRVCSQRKKLVSKSWSIQSWQLCKQRVKVSLCGQHRNTLDTYRLALYAYKCQYKRHATVRNYWCYKKVNYRAYLNAKHQCKATQQKVTLLYRKVQSCNALKGKSKCNHIKTNWLTAKVEKTKVCTSAKLKRPHACKYLTNAYENSLIHGLFSCALQHKGHVTTKCATKIKTKLKSKYLTMQTACHAHKKVLALKHSYKKWMKKYRQCSHKHALLTTTCRTSAEPDQCKSRVLTGICGNFARKPVEFLLSSYRLRIQKATNPVVKAYWSRRFSRLSMTMQARKKCISARNQYVKHLRNAMISYNKASSVDSQKQIANYVGTNRSKWYHSMINTCKPYVKLTSAVHTRAQRALRSMSMKTFSKLLLCQNGMKVQRKMCHGSFGSQLKVCLFQAKKLLCSKYLQQQINTKKQQLLMKCVKSKGTLKNKKACAIYMKYISKIANQIKQNKAKVESHQSNQQLLQKKKAKQHQLMIKKRVSTVYGKLLKNHRNRRCNSAINRLQKTQLAWKHRKLVCHRTSLLSKTSPASKRCIKWLRHKLVSNKKSKQKFCKHHSLKHKKLSATKSAVQNLLFKHITG